MNNKKISTHKVDIFDIIPFSPQSVTFPGFPVLGVVLYAYSTSTDKFGYREWIETKIKDLNIKRTEHLTITKGRWHIDNFHFSAFAGLKIVATFKNQRGAAARIYLDSLVGGYETNIPNATTPVGKILAELHRYQSELHHIMTDVTICHGIGQIQQTEEDTEKSPTPDDKIKTAFAEDAVNQANNRLLHIGTRNFDKTREIVAKMEAIYMSPLYGEAVALGLAPALQD